MFTAATVYFMPSGGSHSADNLYFLEMFWAPLKAEFVSLKARTISGGKRFKRTKKKVEFELTDEDMKYLKENTRYDEEEIQEWFRWGLAFKV